METSSPEKVLMKAAKAPAQVMPLRMEPRMPYFSRIRMGSSSTTLSGPLAPVRCVEFRQEIAAQHAEDRREDIEHADQDHHPHGRPLGGDAVRIGVEPHEDVRQAGRAADERDDQREGVEQRVAAWLPPA